MMRHSRLLIALLSCLGLSGEVQALTSFEHMNLATMVETSTTSLDVLKDMNGNGTNLNTTWTGNFTEGGFNYIGTGTLGSLDLTITYTGTLSGTWGGDITVNFQGSGSLGSDPLEINGSTTWIYDSGAELYTSMLYDDEVHLGTESWWAVIRGAEVLGGGIIGGVLSGGWGALGGATTAWTVSDIAKEVAEGVKPTPPERPNPPPNTDQPPSPQPKSPEGEVYTFNNVSGNININKNFGNRTSTRGGVDDGNNVTASVSTVPIPPTALLFGSGLLVLLGMRQRRLS